MNLAINPYKTNSIHITSIITNNNKATLQLELFDMKSENMPHLPKLTVVLQAAPGRTSNSLGCSAVSESKGFSLHSTSRSSFS